MVTGKQSPLVHVSKTYGELSKLFYSPTDARVNCLKNNFKVDIKTAPTCFGVVTPLSREYIIRAC
jgi:hypothetical protein